MPGAADVTLALGAVAAPVTIRQRRDIAGGPPSPADVGPHHLAQHSPIAYTRRAVHRAAPSCRAPVGRVPTGSGWVIRVPSIPQ